MGLILAVLACSISGVLWIESRGCDDETRESARAVPVTLVASAAKPCVGAPGLGDRMNTIARRFASVWFAGRSGNVDLATYELHELGEVIEHIDMVRPVEGGVDIASVLHAVQNTHFPRLQTALQDKDVERFEGAYENMMHACNDCHVTTGHAFIKIQIPAAPPIPNRKF